MSRTRIKICGLTRPQDVRAAVEHGADAVGFVFYPPSPRYVAPELAAELVRELPPFVTAVGLFVNESPQQIARVLDAVPLQLLQFHGDETPDECTRFRLPWIKVARMRPGFDLIEYAARFGGARGLLLDAHVEGYGGKGQCFDWSLIPQNLPQPVILSGGLDASNVGQAIERVRPWGVDVSSGVESAKGIKDARRIAEFVDGVRNADRRHAPV